MLRAQQEPADVIIVGSGPAGVAAAHAVSDAGASWIGLEAREQLGGAAILGAGGCCLVGTSTQRDLNITDSPELALRDLVDDNPDVDKNWARFYFQRCARDVHDWLLDNGVRFEGVRYDNELCEFQSAPRWHAPAGAGAAMMAALHRALIRHAERGGEGKFLAGARILEIVYEKDVVAGVRVEEGGQTREIYGRTIVLATGGFNADASTIRRYAPSSLRRAPRVLCGGGPGSFGEGHHILAAHGASLVNMDHFWCYLNAVGDHEDLSGSGGLLIDDIASNVWVDRTGRRFHDESLRGAGSATPAYLRLAEPHCFAIIDRQMADRMTVNDPRYRSRDGDPIVARREALLARSRDVSRADGFAALATAAQIDVDGFVETMRAWNALVASGAERDPETGRRLIGVEPIVRPPFYALRFLPLARSNLGGVRTDLHSRVLDGEGEPVPGLYAAGELAGFGGGSLAGRKALEGMMLGASFLSGRVAGAWAAHETGRVAPSGTYVAARDPRVG